MTTEKKLYQRFKRYFIKYDGSVMPCKNRWLIYQLSVLVVYHWEQELPQRISERQYRKEIEYFENLKEELQVGGMYEDDARRALEAYDLYISLISNYRVNKRPRVF